MRLSATSFERRPEKQHVGYGKEWLYNVLNVAHGCLLKVFSGVVR